MNTRAAGGSCVPMMGGVRMLEIQGVSKSYKKGKVKAVENLSLSVGHGEIFGFLGPNGAGKTTTIKMMVGLLNPDSGSITVDGHDIQKDPLAAKSIMGYVPDNPNLFDKLTGLEYLNFIGDVYGVPTDKRRNRARELLSMFELEHALGDLIGSYSHGMRQKLALTGALLSNPRLLVLDEPMVGLDPRSAHLFKELMGVHCANGGTVFFSTHILEVAERLCHRVGIINKGRLIACGTLSDLRRLRDESKDGSLETIFLELTKHE